MSWGTHFCLFYETREDLLDILIPYFKVGLANHEFCLCVASEPVIAEETKQALRETVPGFEQYLSEGQVEIVSHMNWYLRDGHFDPFRVRQGWLDKLEQAHARGYVGMRFAANISWLEQQDWNRFAEYEGKLDEVFRQSHIIGVCAYELGRCLAAGTLDVVRHHQFTLIRRDGTWESLEGAQLMGAREEVLKLNNELEQRVIERTAELATTNDQLKAEIIERVRVEEALRESEELYRFLAENTNDLLILYSLDGNRVYVSPSITRVLGWLPTEVFGGIHPEDVQASKETWQRILAGEKTVYIFRHAHADGSWRWLEAWGSLVYYRGQPHVMAVSRDITERKQAEEALQESRERLQVALQAAEIGTGEWNIQMDRVFLSDGLQRIFGFVSGTIHTSFVELVERVHSEDRQLFLSKVKEALAGKTGFGMDYRVVWPDGSIHWITAWGHIFYNDLGKPIRLIGAAMDITERKRAEQEIRGYATRMEALAEISRTFVEAGLDYQSVLNTVAWRTAEIIGDSCVITLFSGDAQRSFPVAFHHPNPEAGALMHDALLHTWQGGTDTERYQTLLVGNFVYIPTVNEEEFRVTLEPEFWPYLDAVGISSVLLVPLQFQSRVIGTLGITRDRQGKPYTREDLTLLQNIADQAAMSIQNAQLFRQVEGAREQLGALSKRLLEVQESERRALTTELHDRVGQNLTGLSILLQNMKALLSKETVQKLATRFDDAQALVEDTTRQIRDIMAELHLPELEDYGLAAALETYAERVASRGNLKLITDLPDLAPPPLPSDVRIALFRAAQEAISNVLKHAGATQLEISLEGQDGRIRLMVEDDGTGFAPEAAVQRESPSWGLKIMRERIESIGGNVHIESESGKGTQVIFEIERPS